MNTATSYIWLIVWFSFRECREEALIWFALVAKMICRKGKMLDRVHISGLPLKEGGKTLRKIIRSRTLGRETCRLYTGGSWEEKGRCLGPRNWGGKPAGCTWETDGAKSKESLGSGRLGQLGKKEEDDECERRCVSASRTR
eukprot:g8963.t1